MRGVDVLFFMTKETEVLWDAPGICMPRVGRDCGVGDRLPLSMLVESGAGRFIQNVNVGIDTL